MNRRQADSLELGPEVVRILLPHRRPMLMVDRVLAFGRTPVPWLRAERHISANEDVFDGHFPGLKLWPGIYTIEGLGQTCNLLRVLQGMLDQVEQHGGEPQQVLEALRNLELGFRLQPGFNQDLAERLVRDMPDPSSLLGFSTSVEMKFMAPIFAGQCLRYEVHQTHVIEQLVRWEVEAEVQGQPVARGVMTARIGVKLPTVEGLGRW